MYIVLKTFKHILLFLLIYPQNNETTLAEWCSCMYKSLNQDHPGSEGGELLCHGLGVHLHNSDVHGGQIRKHAIY